MLSLCGAKESIDRHAIPLNRMALRAVINGATPRVAVCGGGNAAHILVGMLCDNGYEVSLRTFFCSASHGHKLTDSHHTVQVNLFAPYGDEAEKWKKSEGVTVQMPDGKVERGFACYTMERIT